MAQSGGRLKSSRISGASSRTRWEWTVSGKSSVEEGRRRQVLETGRIEAGTQRRKESGGQVSPRVGAHSCADLRLDAVGLGKCGEPALSEVEAQDDTPAEIGQRDVVIVEFEAVADPVGSLHGVSDRVCEAS